MIKTLHMHLERQRESVLALAHERSDNLAESARLLRIAAEKGDLERIGWMMRVLDVELSVRASTLHAELRVVGNIADAVPKDGDK